MARSGLSLVAARTERGTGGRYCNYYCIIHTSRSIVRFESWLERALEFCVYSRLTLCDQRNTQSTRSSTTVQPVDDHAMAVDYT